MRAVLSLVLACGACAPVALQVPRFEASPCWPSVAELRGARCGYVAVPENRTRSTNREVRLAVVVLPPTEANAPLSDPVLFLPGGPGEAAIDSAAVLVARLAPFRKRRELVLFDQRGTGLSRPDLHCRTMNAVVLDLLWNARDGDAYRSAMIAAARACHAELVARGVDLDAYHTTASAADVDDLRRALGRKQVNLVALSYGTSVALATLRDYPGGVRSAILDGTLPLDGDDVSDALDGFVGSLAGLFAGCARDPECEPAYPHLSDVATNLIARLNRDPARIDIGGRTFWLDGNKLATYLFSTMSFGALVPSLPKQIVQMASGDFSTFSAIIADYKPADTSYGLYYTIMCHERGPFVASEISRRIAAHSEIGRPYFVSWDLGPGLPDLCATWGARRATPTERRAVASAVPTLVMSGEYDPATPAAWGRAAAATLSRGFLVEVPRGGHGQFFASDCAGDIEAEFVDDPSAHPNTGCLKVPRFETATEPSKP